MQQAREQLGPLVVGYDDHASSRRALSFALELAGAVGAPLRILHVVDLEDFPVDPDSASWEEEMQTRERELEEHLRGLVSLPEDRWTYRIVRGDPWHALVTEADQADAWLVVVGEHTHAHAVASAVGRLFGAGRTGSIASELIRHGSRPVLVVPGPAAPGSHLTHPGPAGR